MSTTNHTKINVTKQYLQTVQELKVHSQMLHSDCDDEITICAELHLAFCCMSEADVDFAEQYFYETSTANQQIEALLHPDLRCLRY